MKDILFCNRKGFLIAVCVLSIGVWIVFLSHAPRIWRSTTMPATSSQLLGGRQEYRSEQIGVRFAIDDPRYYARDSVHNFVIFKHGFEDHVAEVGIAAAMSGTNDPQTLLQEVVYLSNSETGIVRTSEAFGFTRFDLTPRGASAPIRYMKSVGNGGFIDVYYKNTGDDAMIESILTSIEVIPQDQE